MLKPEKSSAGNSAETTDWAEAYLLYHKPIFNFVYRRLQHYEDACDVTADIFVRAISAEQRGSGNQHGLEGWLWKITRNMIVDYYRWRQVRRKIGSYDELADLIEDDIDPHSDAEASDLWDALFAASRSLTPEQMQTVNLYAAGYGQAEIGRNLGVATGAIKSRLHRAQATLRDLAHMHLQPSKG